MAAYRGQVIALIRAHLSEKVLRQEFEL